jgi:hypothetical protein
VNALHQRLSAENIVWVSADVMNRFKPPNNLQVSANLLAKGLADTTPKRSPYGGFYSGFAAARRQFHVRLVRNDQHVRCLHLMRE